MRVMITGASGYIGAKLFQDLREHHEVVGTFFGNKLFTDLRQLDVTDRGAVLATTSKVNPDVIVHAAAIASGSRCEQEPDVAIDTNSAGTEHVVEAANLCGARVMYVSSLGALEPHTVYGETKFMGEESAKHARVGYSILRLSVTFGCSPNTRNDRPFNRILRTLSEGQPVLYDNTWRFRPTYLQHVSATIRALLERRIDGRTVTIVVPELKSMFEIASDILRPFGKTVMAVEQNEARVEDVREPMVSGLPTCSYSEMIDGITREIRARGLVGIS